MPNPRVRPAAQAVASGPAEKPVGARPARKTVSAALAPDDVLVRPAIQELSVRVVAPSETVVASLAQHRQPERCARDYRRIVSIAEENRDGDRAPAG